MEITKERKKELDAYIKKVVLEKRSEGKDRKLLYACYEYVTGRPYKGNCASCSFKNMYNQLQRFYSLYLNNPEPEPEPFLEDEPVELLEDELLVIQLKEDYENELDERKKWRIKGRITCAQTRINKIKNE